MYNILGWLAFVALFIFLLIVSGTWDRPIHKLLGAYFTRKEIKEYLGDYRHYMDSTKPCPHCYGRGRVRKDGQPFEHDEYRAICQSEK